MQKFWSILFGAVLLASLLLFIVAPFVGWWLPKSLCSYGTGIYILFYVILAVTGFFFILTEAILVYNMWAFEGQAGRKADYSHGNHKLEMYWTAIPAALLVLLAVSQIWAWNEAKTIPGDEVQVMEVSARQFEWRVRYPSAERMNESKFVDRFAVEAKKNDKDPSDIFVVNEIHTWKGAKVRVLLKTRDVLHSFFLPNIPTKQDAVPGKTLTLWFDTALAKEGNYSWDEKNKKWVETEVWELACAELCGWGHYKMRGKFFVHKDRDDYLEWLRQATKAQNETKAE